MEIRLRESLDRQVFGGASRRHHKSRRVHYNDDSYRREPKDDHAGIDKEDIRIPEPRPRTISRFEHFLAAIMSGGERQMHGLTGKALVYAETHLYYCKIKLTGNSYFTSVFVSLGVFLFGYDQGVMSGIIT